MIYGHKIIDHQTALYGVMTLEREPDERWVIAGEIVRFVFKVLLTLVLCALATAGLVAAHMPQFCPLAGIVIWQS